jgi:hypothetical protein
MARSSYPFPEDEFDAAGADRTPEGVHRMPRARWRALLPFLLVLLLAPTLAYLGVTYLESRSAAETAAPTASVPPSGEVVGQASGAEGVAAAGEHDEAAQATPTASATPQPPAVARDVRVVALNGTGSSGLANHARWRLLADGFTAVEVGQARSRAPSASTVYYNNPALAASAQQAAAVLKIGQVVENASAARSIAIVLRGDYQP